MKILIAYCGLDCDSCEARLARESFWNSRTPLFKAYSFTNEPILIFDSTRVRAEPSPNNSDDPQSARPR